MTVEIKSIHKGETGVIIGNGRSLRRVPKDFLDTYATFGINFINRFPYEPTYYVCVDTDILTHSAGEIISVASKASIAFLLDRHLPESQLYPNLEELYSLDNSMLIVFQQPIRNDSLSIHFEGEYWVTGGTGSYVALKLAYEMGFSTILLVGMDHDEEWAHFDDNYPKGFPTDRNRMQHQRNHFRLANERFRSKGRRIVNLSPKSKLDEIFERGKIEDWIRA
jgi:hypothetical protein